MQLISSLDDQRRQISMGLTNAYWINGRVRKVIPELQDSNKKIFFMSEMRCNGLSKRLCMSELNFSFKAPQTRIMYCKRAADLSGHKFGLCVTHSHTYIGEGGREGEGQKGERICSYYILYISVYWWSQFPLWDVSRRLSYSESKISSPYHLKALLGTRYSSKTSHVLLEQDKNQDSVFFRNSSTFATKFIRSRIFKLAYFGEKKKSWKWALWTRPNAQQHRISSAATVQCICKSP